MIALYVVNYRKMYFKTNRIAKTYISGVIFLRLPQNRLMTTYEMTPMEMPSEML